MYKRLLHVLQNNNIPVSYKSVHTSKLSQDFKSEIDLGSEMDLWLANFFSLWYNISGCMCLEGRREKWNSYKNILCVTRGVYRKVEFLHFFRVGRVDMLPGWIYSLWWIDIRRDYRRLYRRFFAGILLR